MADRGGEVGCVRCASAGRGSGKPGLHADGAVLNKEHLPSGMGSLERVPRLSDSEESSYSARLQEYVAAIRTTARVFEQGNSLQTTRARYDGYMCWIDGWVKLSGFEKLAVVNNEVRLHESMHI